MRRMKNIMDKQVLKFVEKLEGFKTACQNAHWDSPNMSQHELLDKIGDSIAEFEDKVAEVEQSIHGKLKVNKLKPAPYKMKSREGFILDIINETKRFYKRLKGDDYIGMRSDCESFISEMQRYRYLMTFTLRENLRKRLKGEENINENISRNVIRLTESDLSGIIMETVNRILREDIGYDD